MVRTRQQVTLSRPQFECWAILWLARDDEARVRDFLVNNWDIPDASVAKGMHLTVYYARRKVPGLDEASRSANVNINVSESRLMVLAPGGENPRPELDPARRQVGMRVGRRDECRTAILEYRRACCAFETRAVLGDRKASSDRTSAFGARHYQPHISLLRPGSNIDRDLKPLGQAFRARFHTLRLSKFTVRHKNA